MLIVLSYNAPMINFLGPFSLKNGFLFSPFCLCMSMEILTIKAFTTKNDKLISKCKKL